MRSRQVTPDPAGPALSGFVSIENMELAALLCLELLAKAALRAALEIISYSLH